jgi:outer membrane protein assembly factor BamB
MKRLICALLGATLVAAGLTAPAAAQSAHSRLYSVPLPPPREVLDRLNLQLGWRIYVPMADRQDGLATVQLHNDDLYVQTRSGMVLLIDAETGVTRWQNRVGLPYRTAHAVAFNSREVYVVNSTYLYALDRRNGTVRWEHRLPEGVAAAPVADENLIFIPTPSGRLTAYYLPRMDLPPKLAAGLTTSYDVPAETKESIEERRKRLVAIKGDVRSSTPISYLTPGIFDINTKEETGPHPVRVWSHVSSLRLELPILHTYKYLVVPTPNGVVMTLATLPQESGAAAEIYRFNTDSTIRVPAGHYEDMAYLGAEDANLYAMEVSSGKIRWRYTAGTAISRKPAVTDQDIYVVAERNGMTRLDRATGEPMWRIPVRGRLAESNAAADRFLAVNPKYVYAADASGRLLVLERRRGVTLSGFDVKDFVYPISNEITDRLYLAANNGLIVCLHDREYQKPLRYRKGEEQAENPLQVKLMEPIDDVGTPKMALRDLLPLWAQRYPPLKFRIDANAFKAAMRESPEGENVQVPKVDQQPLGDVIKGVLNQIKCTYEVIADTIMILPAAAAPAAKP